MSNGNAPLLTPELARQMLHNAAFYIELRKDQIRRNGATSGDVAALLKYEEEREMLEDWLKEQEA